MPEGAAAATVRALVAAGADVNARRDHAEPSKRCTPLHYALRYGLSTVCEALVDCGADVAAVDTSVPRLLELITAEVAYIKDSDPYGGKVAALVAAGVDFSGAKDPESGEPLLFKIASHGSQAGVLALVEAGADATARDAQGRTPLQAMLRKRSERHGRPWMGRITAVTVASLVAAGDVDSWDTIAADFYSIGSLMGPLGDKAPTHLARWFQLLPAAMQATVREALRAVRRLVPGEGLEEVRFKIVAQAVLEEPKKKLKRNAAAAAAATALEEPDKPAEAQKTEITRFLASNSGLNEQAIPMNTPSNLHAAAAAGDEELVRQLIGAGADLDATCFFVYDTKYHYKCARKLTPLSLSCAFNHPRIAQLLIDAGAKLTPFIPPSCSFGVDTTTCPLIFLAIEHGAEGALDVLLRTGKLNVNEIWTREAQDEVITPLHAAVDAIDAAPEGGVLRRLLAEPGINTEVRLEYHFSNDTPLMVAIERGHVAAVQALLDGGADFREGRVRGWSWDNADDDLYYGKVTGTNALHAAAAFHATALVALLVAAGIDVEGPCAEGFSPLAIAAFEMWKGSAEKGEKTIAALISLGAHVNARRVHENPALRKTPLYYVLRYGTGAAAKALLRLGADITAVEASPQELAGWALKKRLNEYNRHSELIDAKFEALCAAGVDMNGVEVRPGRLLLHELASKGCTGAVMALVAAGADAGVKSRGRKTALALLVSAANEKGGRPWKGKISAETVAACVRGGDLDSWTDIPREFEGLECLLEYVHENAPDKLGALFRKLMEGTQAVVREAVRALHHFLPGGEGVDKIRIGIITQAFLD